MTQNRSRRKSPFYRLRKWWSKNRSRSESLRSRRSSSSKGLLNLPARTSRNIAITFQRLLGSGRRARKNQSLRSNRNSFFGNLLSIPQRLLRLLYITVLRFFHFQGRQSLTVTQAAARGDFRRLKVAHFLNPLNWILWPLGFVFSYFLSRPYLSIGPALFAIAVVAGMIALVAQKRGTGNSSRMQSYQRLLANNLQSKNLDSALICAKTLIDIAPNDRRFKFERAKIEHDLGHKELADELMMRLATNDKSGLAALWLVSEKLNVDEVKNWQEKDHQLFRGLLAIALSDSDRLVADGGKLKMASYLTQINAYSDALNYLEGMTKDNPQFALTAAELALKVNDNVRLQTLLPIALSYQREELTKDPANIKLRIQLARTLVIDDQIDESLQLIADGLKIKQDPGLQNALGDGLILKASKIAQRKQTPETIIERMQLVHQASTIAPNSPLVIEALIDLTLEFRKNTNREIEVLREAALQGLNPECVHFVRGTMALLDNNIPEAKTHLELAAKAGMQLPGLLNNLAVTLASQEGGDLQQALNLSNSALEQLQHPYLFETRGQILFKMERYQDCILDLEKGLQAKELANVIYPSLVTAYQKLNNEPLAQEYAKRLQELTTSSSTQNGPEP
jgi:hypothetical protein